MISVNSANRAQNEKIKSIAHNFIEMTSNFFGLKIEQVSYQSHKHNSQDLKYQIFICSFHLKNIIRTFIHTVTQQNTS